jgi:hypothetical protein
VHIPLLESHLTEAPYIGVGFLLLIVAGFIAGTKLLAAPDKRAWTLCGLVATLALLGYMLSRTVGLPQIQDDVGDWQNPLGTVAILCEITMVVETLVQFAVSRRGQAVSGPRPRCDQYGDGATVACPGGGEPPAFLVVAEVAGPGARSFESPEIGRAVEQV